MRRSNKRLTQPMFRGRELPRLMTMIVMLAVIFMLMTRASDPGTWRWLTNELASTSHDDQTVGSDSRAAGETTDDSVQWTLNGPTDQDPEEADAAREEFQAITDKAPLQKVEMPSYWRMLKWVENQPLALLEGRSQKDVLFTNFAETPNKYRGKIAHLKLHLMRSLTYETEDSPVGIKRLYEAWGWTDESQPWPYIVVFADRPPEMPIGPDIREEASFDGYFLKLMSYEAHDKTRFAPLLVGRIVWHPVKAARESNKDWFWPTMLLGGLLFVWMIVRWTLTLASRPARPPASTGETNEQSVENWIKQTQQEGATSEQAGPGEATDSDDLEQFQSGFDRNPDPKR